MLNQMESNMAGKGKERDLQMYTNEFGLLRKELVGGIKGK